MSIRNHSRLLLAASGLAIAALPSPAAAQKIDRIVAFGDSYADDNNFFQFVGINPVTTGAYPTGRFSGGTNYIDTLAIILGVPVDNFAIGGALTTQFNTNVGPALGFPTQYGSFLTGGAGATPFPAVSGTFDENDLLAISIGGNDARIYQTGNASLGVPVGTLAGAPTAGANSAAAAKAGLDLLVNAGAPTISYLAGSTANIPEVGFQASPALAFAVRDAFFQSFDAAMRNTLAGYAANGVMVHYLDLNLVSQRIQADFAAYGLKGLACPPFAVSTICISDSTFASQYLFYGDQLHLTSAGFAIVAQYVAAQLTAPLTLQAPNDVALNVGHQFGRTLDTRMNFARFGADQGGLKVFLVGDSLTHNFDSGEHNDRFQAKTLGATIGVEFGFAGGVAGLAANISRPKTEFTNDAADNKGKSVQIGGYAAMGFGGAFAQGYVGYGKDDHDIRRQGVIDSMSADADGNHWIAGAKAGYLVPLGPVRLGPVAALNYAKAKVDGYTEEGDAALTLNVSSISGRSMRGSAGIELRGDIDMGGLNVQPYGALVAEKELLDGGRSVTFSQTSAPTIVNSWDFDDRSKKVYGRFNAGLSAGLLSNVAIDGAVSMTFGNNEETSGHLGLKIGF